MTRITYIRAGWLIDGSGRPPQRDMLLTVVGGQIEHIDSFGSGEMPPPHLFEDLSFATILPTFIDSHTHLAMSGSIDINVREHQLIAGCSELEEYIKMHLKLNFDHGVLAIRDGGDRAGCVLDFLRKSEKLQYPVEVFSPGPAYYRKGRYGKLIGRCVGERDTPAGHYAREGHSGHYVKLINSGLNSLNMYGRQTDPQFSAEEIRQLVAVAAQDGKKVMVHANGESAVEAAIEGGCHSIEHGFFMGSENMRRLADSGSFWVPTMSTMKAYAEILEHDRQPVAEEIARKNLQHQLEQLNTARELGVRVALGTDSGSPGVLHGEAIFEEMKLFVKAGYSLGQTVQSATSAGAELLGITPTGVLSRGSRADFLVARGTPAQLPRKLSYLENIFIGGEQSPYYRKNPHKHVSADT